MSDKPLTPGSLGGLPLQRVSQRAPYLNFLVYGDSGIGKTYLCGSADEVPEMRPVLMIDFEGGTESIVRSFPDIQQVRVENWKQMQAVYDELHAGKTGFNTVILDSLTEIQKFNMYSIMEELVADKPEREIDVPSMREWGRNLEQMRKFVRAFRDLPMNSIFTALKEDKKNDKTGMVTTRPSLSGKLADEVAAFLDIVAYYYTRPVEGEETRLLLTKKTETVIAKDRTSQLPEVMMAPTMAEIYEHIDKDRSAAI